MVSITKAMGLLTKEATKLIIEGKLTEMSREPRNVQVEVKEGDGGKVTIYLHNSHSAFVEADCQLQEEGRAEGDKPVVIIDDPGGGGNGEWMESDYSAYEDAATELMEAQAQNGQPMILNDELTAQMSTLQGEVSTLTDKLRTETERVSEGWRTSCEQVSGFDEAVTAKDAEIDRLKARIAELEASRVDSTAVPALGMHVTEPASPRVLAVGHSSTEAPPSPHSSGGTAAPVTVAGSSLTATHRGKAPPISEFIVEDPDCTLDDWLPSLEWAIMWNTWTEEEQIIQLAGHLKSHALQEWNLLGRGERTSFS